MICSNCKHEQESGKFCGKCGTPFETTTTPVEEPIVAAPTTERVSAEKVVTEQPTATEPNQSTTAPAEPNVYVENTKEKSKLYLQYFLQQLNAPSIAKTQGSSNFSNAVISILLLALLISLSFSAGIGSANIYGPSFFSVFIGMLFFSIVSMALAIASLWLVNNFFGPQHSFKSIVNLYGGHLSLILLVAALSLLLMMVKSYTFGTLSLLIIILFSVMLLPLYLISVLLTKKSNALDPLYAYMIFIVGFSIIYMIFTFILADSTIGTLLNDFQYYF